MPRTIDVHLDLLFDPELATTALHRVLGASALLSGEVLAVELGDDRRLHLTAVALDPFGGSQLRGTLELPTAAVGVTVSMTPAGTDARLEATLLDVDGELGEGWSLATARSMLVALGNEVSEWVRAITLANHPSVGLG